MKKRFVFLLLITSLFCHSQNENQVNTLDYAFSPGLIIQDELFGEANVVIGSVVNNLNSKIPIVGIAGVRLGFESNFKSGNQYIIAPKIGLEFTPMLLCLRISAIKYFQNKESEFRILPEIGLSVGGSINLTYGYGVSIGNTIDSISKHRFGLSFNINKTLNTALYPGVM